mgnify:FL=1
MRLGDSDAVSDTLCVRTLGDWDTRHVGDLGDAERLRLPLLSLPVRVRVGLEVTSNVPDAVTRDRDPL